MITFANGWNFETIRIFGSSEVFQGQQRKTLEIDFYEDELSLDQARSIYTNPDILKEISVETDGQSSVQLNYTLPVELSWTTERKKLNVDSDKMIITLKVAQKSSLEIEQEKTASDMNLTQNAILELADAFAAIQKEDAQS